MPDHLPKSISEKPLFTLRFHQMRLSFLLGSLWFVSYIYAVYGQDIVILVLLLVTAGNAGVDVTSILMQKRGMKSASPLIYESGNYSEFLRIIKAIFGTMAAWLLSLVITFILAEDYQTLWLRVSAILVFNIISIAVIRWGQEVHRMLTDYGIADREAYRKLYRASSYVSATTPHLMSASLPVTMRPFTPNDSGQTAPQPVQPQSVSVASLSGAQPYLPVASLPATMRPFTPNDSGQAVPQQQTVSIAIRKGVQP